MTFNVMNNMVHCRIKKYNDDMIKYDNIISELESRGHVLSDKRKEHMRYVLTSLVNNEKRILLTDLNNEFGTDFQNVFAKDIIDYSDREMINTPLLCMTEL